MGLHMSPFISRRGFLVATASVAASPIITACTGRRNSRYAGRASSTSVVSPYGPLQPVVDLETNLPLLQLPQGFQYRSHSWTGDAMANGAPAPGFHDGMGVIAAERRGEEVELVLVRNHERGFDSPVVAPARYDRAVPADEDDPPAGGTTHLRFRHRHWLDVQPSLGGTLENCAGGVTPWGSWLSCEETLDDLTAQGGRRHGYVFEVRRNPAQTTGRAIVAMGRMKHEAVAIDPATNYAYLTEDNRESSGFYRFIPKDRSGTVGSYEAGGRLQAARVAGSRNADLSTPTLGERHQLRWIDLAEPDADPGITPVDFPDAHVEASGPFLEAWSRGALRMTRCEGICFHAGKIYVVDTKAGTGLFGRRGHGHGAVWEYDPRTEELYAMFVSGAKDVADNPDNVTVSVRGGMVLCENGKPLSGNYGPGTRLLGLTKAGASYPFAMNNVQLNATEVETAGKDVLPGDYRGEQFAGACFDPAGEVLFVNIQSPGITFAIWGPWTDGNL